MTAASLAPQSESLVRAFFALELSPEARCVADAVVSELRGCGDGVRWVRPENFHVTLRFLGEVPRSRLAAVVAHAIDALDRAPKRHEPFEMYLGDVGAFPSPGRPRVIFLDVTPHEPLRALASSLERGASEAGLVTSSVSSFRSHLTLGRVRRNRRAPSLEALGPIRRASTHVDGIGLFRSELSRSGARYTRLEQIEFVKRN